MKLLGIGSILLQVLLCSVSAGTMDNFNESYQNISSVKQRKLVFKDILLPKIKSVNREILKERDFVKKFFKSHYLTSSIDRYHIYKLTKLAKKYRIKNIYNEKSYLKKIAPIPEALALAQAATESAWGKSRFAKDANNIYGEWTWGKKGIVPKKRENGKKHKIKLFSSLRKSIASYMLNLNRHKAYKKFRDLRYSFYEKNKKFRGVDAATTMNNYSAIGEEYNKILKKIIRSNGWDK